MNILDEYMNAAFDYDRELGTYVDGEEHNIFDVYRYYGSFDKESIHNFIEGDKYIGFIIIVKASEIEYHIAETYVKPEYRNKGYLTRFLDDFISKNKGIYTYYVLKNNKPALKFWRNYFTRRKGKIIESPSDLDCAYFYEVRL